MCIFLAKVQVLTSNERACVFTSKNLVKIQVGNYSQTVEKYFIQKLIFTGYKP